MKRLSLLLILSLAAILFAEAPSSACLRNRRLICVQPIELTPNAAKQALLAMMRSEPGKELGFFDKELADEMAKIDVEKKRDEYHWTGAYRFDLKKATYVLFVSLHDDRPPLRPHPKGYLIHLQVYQGSFEMKDGHWIATVPKYKYVLLD